LPADPKDDGGAIRDDLLAGLSVPPIWLQEFVGELLASIDVAEVRS
jgi:hypothetical protein